MATTQSTAAAAPVTTKPTHMDPTAPLPTRVEGWKLRLTTDDELSNSEMFAWKAFINLPLDSEDRAILEVRSRKFDAAVTAARFRREGEVRLAEARERQAVANARVERWKATPPLAKALYLMAEWRGRFSSESAFLAHMAKRVAADPGLEGAEAPESFERPERS